MTTQAEPLKDQCPTWASSLIHTIKELEIKLGNLRPDSAWSEATLDTVMARAERDAAQVSLDESTVEGLFKKVSWGLSDEGHSPEAIAGFINSRLTAGQRLAYCSSEEVREAIASR
jgi:hypothetical protein